MQTPTAPMYTERQTLSSPTQVTRKPLPPSTATSTHISPSGNVREINQPPQTSTKLPKMNIMKSQSLRLPQTSSIPAPSQTALKKSKSVRVKSTLKAIANPVKTRKDKKTTKSELEMKEREEATRNVDDFLTSGRIYYEKQLQDKNIHEFSRL